MRYIALIAIFALQSYSTAPVEHRFRRDYPKLSIAQKDDVLELNEDVSSVSNRTKRASGADDFQTKADKMAMIGRVLTGISLQNGLIDGSIPGDEAIAEMLNIGSVKLEELEKFDKAKVDMFVKNLKDVSNKLDDTTATLEHDIIDMAEIKEEYAKVGDLSKLPTDSEFQNFETLNSVNMTLFLNSSTLTKVIASIENINNMPDDTDKTTQSNQDGMRMVHKLEGMLTKLDKFLNAVSVEKRKVDVQKLLNLVGNVDPWKEFVNTMKVTNMASFSGFSQLDDSKKNALKDNLKEIKTLAGTNNAELSIIKNLVVSRFHYISSQRKHTSGFVNGISDLKNVEADLIDPWVVTTLNSSMPISKGLGLLLEFAEPMIKLDQKWATISNWDAYQSLKEAERIQELLRKSSVSPESFATVLGSFETCYTPFRPSVPLTTEMIFLSNSFSSLKAKLDALAAVISLVTDEKKKVVDSLRATSKTDFRTISTDVTAIIANLKKIKTHPETIGWLQKFEPHLQTIQDEPSMSKILLDLQDRKINVIDFKTKASKYFTFFDCLKAVTDNTEPVKQASHIFKELRGLKDSKVFYDGISKSSDMVHNSVKDLKSIQTIPGSMKKDQSGEVKELLKFKGVEKEAKMFGDAVAGVVAIQKALEKKSTFEVLITKAQVVDTHINQLSQADIKEDVQRWWGDSGKMVSSAKTLISELLKRTTPPARRRRQASDLTSFGSFASGLTGITDVNLNVDLKLKALDALVAAQSSSRADMQPVQNALKEVSQLNLQFSSGSSALNSLSGILNSIRDLFVKVQPTQLKKPSGGGGGGSVPGTTQSSPTVKTLASVVATATVVAVTVASFFDTWFYPIVGVLAFAFFGAVGVAVFFFYKNKQKNEFLKQAAKEKKLAKDGIKETESKAAETKEKLNKATAEKERLAQNNEQKKKELRDLEQRVGTDSKQQALLDEKRKEVSDAQEELKNAVTKEEELEEKDRTAQKCVKLAKVHYKKVEETHKVEKRKYDMLIEKYKNIPPMFHPGFQLEVSKDCDADILYYNLCKIQLRIPGISFFVKFSEGFDEKYKDSIVIAEFYKVHGEHAMKIIKEKTPLEKVGATSSCRNPSLGIWKKTTVYVPSGRSTFASYITFPKKGNAILAQLPVRGEEETFYEMAWKEGSEDLVYFGHNGDNSEKNFPDAEKETKTYGKFKVIVKSKQTFDSGVILRVLEIVNTDLNETRTLKHYEFINWKDSRMPKDKGFRKSFEKVHRATRRKDKPVIAYDVNGSCKAGVFLGVELYAQSVIDKGPNMYSALDFMVYLYKMRGGILTEGDQLFFIRLMAMQSLYTDTGTPFPSEIDDQWTIFEQFYSEDYDTQCCTESLKNGGGDLAPVPRIQMELAVGNVETKEKSKKGKDEQKKSKKETSKNSKETTEDTGTRTVGNTQDTEISTKAL